MVIYAENLLFMAVLVTGVSNAESLCSLLLSLVFDIFSSCYSYTLSLIWHGPGLVLYWTAVEQSWCVYWELNTLMILTCVLQWRQVGVMVSQFNWSLFRRTAHRKHQSYILQLFETEIHASGLPSQRQYF